MRRLDPCARRARVQGQLEVNAILSTAGAVVAIAIVLAVLHELAAMLIDIQVWTKTKGKKR